MIMSGKVMGEEGDAPHFELIGKGVNGTNTRGWIYSYYGLIIPKWPQGVNQSDVLVGSTVHDVEHNREKPGKVATFSMVRK